MPVEAKNINIEVQVGVEELYSLPQVMFAAKGERIEIKPDKQDLIIDKIGKVSRDDLINSPITSTRLDLVDEEWQSKSWVMDLEGADWEDFSELRESGMTMIRFLDLDDELANLTGLSKALEIVFNEGGSLNIKRVLLPEEYSEEVEEWSKEPMIYEYVGNGMPVVFVEAWELLGMREIDEEWDRRVVDELEGNNRDLGKRIRYQMIDGEEWLIDEMGEKIMWAGFLCGKDGIDEFLIEQAELDGLKVGEHIVTRSSHGSDGGGLSGGTLGEWEGKSNEIGDVKIKGENGEIYQGAVEGGLEEIDSLIDGLLEEMRLEFLGEMTMLTMMMPVEFRAEMFSGFMIETQRLDGGEFVFGGINALSVMALEAQTRFALPGISETPELSEAVDVFDWPVEASQASFEGIADKQVDEAVDSREIDLFQEISRVEQVTKALETKALEVDEELDVAEEEDFDDPEPEEPVDGPSPSGREVVFQTETEQVAVGQKDGWVGEKSVLEMESSITEETETVNKNLSERDSHEEQIVESSSQDVSYSGLSGSWVVGDEEQGDRGVLLATEEDSRPSVGVGEQEVEVSEVEIPKMDDFEWLPESEVSIPEYEELGWSMAVPALDGLEEWVGGAEWAMGVTIEEGSDQFFSLFRDWSFAAVAILSEIADTFVIQPVVLKNKIPAMEVGESNKKVRYFDRFSETMIN